MGFYYLNSRYYDPAIGRFINPDDVSLLGAKSLKRTIFNNILSKPVEIGFSNGLNIVSGITKGLIFGFW